MKIKKMSIILAVLTVGAIGAGALSISVVKPGYVHAVYSPFGGIKDTVLTQGFKFKSPIDTATPFAVASQQLYMSKDSKEGSSENDSFDVMAKDGSLNVDLEITYSFDAEKVPEIYTKYGGLSGAEIINTIARGKIKTYVSEVTSRFSVIEVHMEKKGEINKLITEHLATKMDEFGIIIESANITRTSVDPKVQETIVKRMQVSQELEIEKSKKTKAELEKERMLVESSAKAEAKVIESEGIAEANAKIAASLTDNVIQSEAIKKWDGKLPTTSGANGIILNKKE